MTFTYYSPDVDEVSEIRFLCQDTIEAEHFLEDEEIQYLLNRWVGRDKSYIAAEACNSIATKLARETSFSSDSQSISLDGLMQKYLTLAAELRGASKESAVGELYVGGAEISGSRPPAFGTGMHDSPSAGGQDFGDVGDHYGYNDWYQQWGIR